MTKPSKNTEEGGDVIKGEQLSWFGLYSEKWSDLVHPSAIAHP